MMDIYTKFFLANLAAALAAAWIDSNLLNDGIERMPFVGKAFGLWSLLSLLSIPAWLFYIIISM